MNNQTQNFNAFVDFSKKAFAPAAKLNEVAVQNFEKLTRQQYAFAGEVLEYAFKQLKLTASTKDVNELAAKQVELSTQFVEKATAHSQDLVKMATESQAQLTKWFDQTTTEAASAGKKAA